MANVSLRGSANQRPVKLIFLESVSNVVVGQSAIRTIGCTRDVNGLTRILLVTNLAIYKMKQKP